jgi:UDP-2-acetamido-3-amino-2,3-dideoxy-glucuronate N-acetyltransferase
VSGVTGSFIHPTAIVEDGAQLGQGCSVWHHAHVRSGARVGEGSILGKNVYIDIDAVVGSRVKIQNNVSVYHGVVIGDEVFVGPSAVFTNDRYPRATSTDWEIVPTIVERGASIGANATIVCGVTLGAWCVVGAGAVVTRDVAPHQLVLGNPARHHGWVCEHGLVISRAAAPPDAWVCSCADR